MGEEAAARYLAAKGCAVIDKNYRSRFGEIDIIAERGEYIIFAEVKMRSQSFAGLPREAVGAAKQRRIIKTAMMYLSERACAKQPRFDVIEVTAKNNDIQINHIENAFDLRGFDEAF